MPLALLLGRSVRAGVPSRLPGLDMAMALLVLLPLLGPGRPTSLSPSSPLSLTVGSDRKSRFLPIDGVVGLKELTRPGVRLL